jgi:glycyl-tRNA synthetase beta chain
VETDINDFLLEIGCEEIPARMLTAAASDLTERVLGVLDAANLAHGAGRTLCTPRRLAVIVKDVQRTQADRDEEVLGPPVKAAFGPDGSPSKAAVGFAQKLGVEPAALERVQTPKGEYLGLRRRVAGVAAAAVMAEGLPRAVEAMTFPKTMRWGDGARRFVRPVHWIVALLGAEIVPIGILGIRSGRESWGHRVHGARRIPIASGADYEGALATQGIVVDRERRRKVFAERLDELAKDAGVRAVPDTELLEEVADLVEHPGAVLGSFPIEFLSLPREILITTLRHHQKAFSTEKDGLLANHFLVVTEAMGDPEGHIRKGNEWVVVGRLEDARFFFSEDRRTPFAERTERLSHITFHAKAGSYADKSRRIESLAAALAEIANAAWAERGEDRRVRTDILRRAALLSKCDLTTGLVGEFPELQGIAGGLYLRAEDGSGAGEAVAGAVYDQYRPAAAGDALPATLEGALLALADRVDSLAVLARCVGLPTGSRDPFGLRRAAYGALRIVAETPLPLGLDDLIEAACGIAEKEVPRGAEGAERGDVRGFLMERLQFRLREKGARYDTVNAVVLAARGERAPKERIPRLVEKVFALERVRELADFAALAEMHKRCRNILQQAEGTDGAARLATAMKSDPGEKPAFEALERALADSSTSVGSAVRGDDFEGALQHLATIRPFLSGFFEHVLVMHPEPPERRRRLDLIARTAELIEGVADLKQISMSKEDLQKLEQLRTGDRGAAGR